MAANDTCQQDTCDLTGFSFSAYQKQVQQQQNELLQLLINQQATAATPEETDEDSDITHTAGFSNVNDTVDDDKDLDELLINEVKSYKCLWDPRCRAYKETPKKLEAWKIISIKLSKSGESQI